MPATQILVLGNQGAGKSTAWETMNPDEVVIITPNAKPLPWAGSAKHYIVGKNRIQTNKLTDIPVILKKINKDMLNVKVVLIEDITHFFNAKTMSADFTGRKFGNDAFAKWGEFANEVGQVIVGAETLRDDLTIVYHGHTESADDGRIVMQTPGRLLDKDFKIQSYFTYVLHALIIKQEKGVTYKFLTNDDGSHEAKTPRGCFKDLLIDNDIKIVIETIRKFQGN